SIYRCNSLDDLLFCSHGAHEVILDFRNYFISSRYLFFITEKFGMNKFLLISCFLLNAVILSAQLSKSEFYNALIGKDSLVDFVLKNRSNFRLQFIVTDISRDENGEEYFKSYDFSTNEYFYPASMVKFPTAIVMMEILDSLKIPLNSCIKMNSDVSCGNNSFAELTQKKDIPINLALEDMLSISDNPYYSLFFHAVTPELLNTKLLSRGIKHTKIYSSFSGCPKGKSVETNSYTIYGSSGKILLSRPKTHLDSVQYMNRLSYDKNKLLGKYVIESDKKIEKPFDFNYQLDYPLNDIHETIFRLVFPTNFEIDKRFKISHESRKFLLKCMGNFPREMKNKTYHNISVYPDNYFKYSIIGNDPKLSLTGKYRTFSKIGISYGFVTESAYIVDFEKQKDFLFTVSIYVNEDGIVNDGKYEYDKIARPFIANFTKVIQTVLSQPDDQEGLYTYEYFKLLREIMDGN
ncbi:MAG: hypothetical protein RLZ10_1094, partial [Bacteroidota bacterium]